MAKVMLQITKISGNQKSQFEIIGIKKCNKIIYFDNGSKVIVIKDKNSIIIKVLNKDVENNLLFKKKNSKGFFLIKNKKLEYEIILNNMIIEDKRLEIDYQVEEDIKYILEELND